MDRTGLYIMMFVTMIASFSSCSSSERIEELLEAQQKIVVEVVDKTINSQ